MSLHLCPNTTDSYYGIFSWILTITALIWLISQWLNKGPFQEFWSAARAGTAIMFVEVGIMHLVRPETFTYMIPDIFPYPLMLVILSGVTEIVFGVGLLWPGTRRISAILLIVQLIAIFPANIHVAINGLAAPGGLPAESWYTWSRLAFQPIYIFWVCKAALVTAKTGPVKRRRTA